MDSVHSIRDCENPITLRREHNTIQFKNVNFEYVENVPVLKNINLDIKCGETTIVNLLPRFYDVKSGSITIDDIDIRKYSRASLRQNIAVVF